MGCDYYQYSVVGLKVNKLIKSERQATQIPCFNRETGEPEMDEMIRWGYTFQGEFFTSAEAMRLKMQNHFKCQVHGGCDDPFSWVAGISTNPKPTDDEDDFQYSGDWQGRVFCPTPATAEDIAEAFKTAGLILGEEVRLHTFIEFNC
jgi:hypothetical protein